MEEIYRFEGEDCILCLRPVVSSLKNQSWDWGLKTFIRYLNVNLPQILQPSQKVREVMEETIDNWEHVELSMCQECCAETKVFYRLFSQLKNIKQEVDLYVDIIQKKICSAERERGRKKKELGIDKGRKLRLEILSKCNDTLDGIQFDLGRDDVDFLDHEDFSANGPFRSNPPNSQELEELPNGNGMHLGGIVRERKVSSSSMEMELDSPPGFSSEGIDDETEQHSTSPMDIRPIIISTHLSSRTSRTPTERKSSSKEKRMNEQTPTISVVNIIEGNEGVEVTAAVNNGAESNLKKNHVAYKCDPCSKVYADYSGLYRHRKMKHGEESGIPGRVQR